MALAAGPRMNALGFVGKSLKQQLWRNMAFSGVAAQEPKLKGKVAVVTASTDGIGLAIAEHLAANGARVVISSRKQSNVDKAVSELKGKGLDVLGIQCHVGKKEDRENLIKHAVEKAGGIDILVSNAAVNPVMAQVLDTPEESWDKIFDINVKCAFLLSQAVVPHMEKRGGGSIVYISSIGGFQPFAFLGAYSVSKTALLGLAKAVAHNCAMSNIRVNCVCPGVVRTRFSTPLWTSEEALDKIKDMTPLGRIAEPKDISGIVTFLCSDEASYITGENFVVAGGMQSRL